MGQTFLIRVIRVIRGFTRNSEFRVMCVLMAITTDAHAQSASLYGMPGQRPGLTLSDSSWCFQQLEPPKQIQLNDQITVIVKENAQFTADGEVDRRKRSNIDAKLQDWILLKGGNLKLDEFNDGEPRIRGSLNSQLRTQMKLDTSEVLQFRITAKVVDIRPNGTLVLEAHNTIKNNNEIWEHRLSGIVAREDILPNRTVLSEKIADLKIEKCEQGHVRDAYKRGWLMRWIDTAKPF